MASWFTQRKPSSPSCASGLSLVELMVAMTVTLGVMGGAMTLALSARSVVEADQHRTTINQSLRNAMDLVGIDVKQAGARLPKDFPVVEVRDGINGSPDTLVVRRNLLSEIMPLCADIAAGSALSDVKVALAGGEPGCDPVADADADGWPDNLEVWRDHRVANSGTVRAYIYDPKNKVGEFFPIDDEDEVLDTLHRSDGQRWSRTYRAVDYVRIYMLEQHELALDQGILRMVVNDETGTPLNLLNNVADLQIQVFFMSKGDQSYMNALDDWTDLESLEVTMVGAAGRRASAVERRLVTRFFPRNVLSR